MRDQPLIQLNSQGLRHAYVCSSTTWRKSMHTATQIAAIAALIFASTVTLAQQPPAPGRLQGPATESGSGPGTGPRSGRLDGPGFGREYTPGWAMMSGAERDAHRTQMLSARTSEECRRIRDEHRKLMTERAKARGIPNMPGPRRDACANFQP
jgi:hypothetical protein